MTADGDLQAMGQEALQLERAGRLDEAEAAYQRLLERWPDLPDTWFNLAVLQRKARRFEAALASYQQALDRGVSQPEEAHLNRGVIYSDCLRRDEAAAAELRAALSLNPALRAGVAQPRQPAGGPGTARGCAGSVRARPGHRPALPCGAGALCQPQDGDEARTQRRSARLRAALALPGVSAADRANLGFALGAALEKAGALRPGLRGHRRGQPAKPPQRRTRWRALRPRRSTSDSSTH